MSLAQHLTAEDGFERVGREDEQADTALAAPSAWRRMSFDAFATVESHTTPEQPRHEAAYKASTFQRVCTNRHAPAGYSVIN